ncbi:DNA repair endonuclease XPF [Bulinus truncatus]|nr:DNA repair endonuclease XPF [Bulinus truncatus]
MLEFENQIFLDAFQEDGLLIMSRGLSINRIFSEFLKVYSDPASLVLVLNTTPADELYFTELLEKQGISDPPKIVTNEISASERQLTYAQGGVLFITSRILVVDLLTDRVPVEHITGIMVFKAHKIIESCQEAFILRLYRQKNKTGFIKAFTDNPEAYTRGFCHVERMMKNLHVKKLFLWPRFHASVVSTFKTQKVDVVEIHQTMTPAMTACQTSLLDLINACINELKRSNPSIDTDEITVENALSKSFETIIRLQLEPVWHQLSSRTRQLVTDLKTLRLILKHLTQYDSVTFFCLVQSIRTSEKLFGQNSGWLFLDSADSLYMQAKQRVYGQVKCSKTSNTKKDGDEIQESSEDEEEVSHGLEQCPKWKALTEVLDEIKQEEDECVENGSEPLTTSKGCLWWLSASPMTIIHPITRLFDPHGLSQLWRRSSPNLLYSHDADISLVRQLEVIVVFVYLFTYVTGALRFSRPPGPSTTQSVFHDLQRVSGRTTLPDSTSSEEKKHLSSLLERKL